MQIPFNYSVDIIKEKIDNVEEVYYINEACHSFEKQYETAEFLAMCAYNAIENGEESINVNVSKISEGKIRNVTILIRYFEGITFDFTAKVKDMTKEKDFTIEISYGTETKMRVNEKIKNLYKVISHELMHYNIFYSRYVNNVKNFDDTPEYYDKVVQKYISIKGNSLFKKFLYAIYSTYYQEAQAIASEVYTEIEPYNKDNLIEKLKESQGYKIFQQNLYLVKVIKNSDKLCNEIREKLNVIGIHIDLNKAIDKIEKISKKSINNIINNLYFNLK